MKMIVEMKSQAAAPLSRWPGTRTASAPLSRSTSSGQGWSPSTKELTSSEELLMDSASTWSEADTRTPQKLALVMVQLQRLVPVQPLMLMLLPLLLKELELPLVMVMLLVLEQEQVSALLLLLITNYCSLLPITAKLEAAAATRELVHGIPGTAAS
jgi:hypothetical protein